MPFLDSLVWPLAPGPPRPIRPLPHGPTLCLQMIDADDSLHARVGARRFCHWMEYDAAEPDGNETSPLEFGVTEAKTAAQECRRRDGTQWSTEIRWLGLRPLIGCGIKSCSTNL